MVVPLRGGGAKNHLIKGKNGWKKYEPLSSREGGGTRTIVARPLKKVLIFCVSSLNKLHNFIILFQLNLIRAQPWRMNFYRGNSLKINLRDFNSPYANSVINFFWENQDFNRKPCWNIMQYYTWWFWRLPLRFHTYIHTYGFMGKKKMWRNLFWKYENN